MASPVLSCSSQLNTNRRCTTQAITLLQIHTDSQQAPTFREVAALSDCYVHRKLCARSRECHIVAQQRLTWRVGGQGQRGVGEGGDGHHGGVSMAEHAAGSCRRQACQALFPQHLHRPV